MYGSMAAAATAGGPFGAAPGPRRLRGRTNTAPRLRVGLGATYCAGGAAPGQQGEAGLAWGLEPPCGVR